MIKIWKTNDHFFFKKFWKKKKNILKKNLIIDHFNWSLVFQKFYYFLWTFGLSTGFVLFSVNFIMNIWPIKGFYEHLATQSKSDYQGVLCCFHIFLNIFLVNWAQEMVSDHTFCACFWRNPIPNFNFCGEMLVFKCAPKTHVRLAHLGTQFVFLCSKV